MNATGQSGVAWSGGQRRFIFRSSSFGIHRVHCQSATTRTGRDPR
jgi:hypothetical protein